MKLRRKKKLLKEIEENIPDFRTHEGKIVFKISEVLFLILFALLKGKNSFRKQHTWMEANRENRILLKLFEKKEPLNIPSPSTLHHIAINIDNNVLEKIFRDFFEKHINKKNLAVDGKWINGSGVSGQYVNEKKKIMFNILDKNTKLVIGHKLIEKDKKSEISVFQELLDDKEFFSKGQVFSFDALTTQIDILDKINSDGNFYLAYVKGNQSNLQKKVISTIDLFDKPTEIYEDDKFDYIIERSKYVHRRVEIYQSKNCDIVMFDSKFKNIQTLIKIIKTTTDKKTGEIKEIVKYMIANYKESAEDFKNRILQHWLIETNHFYLDTLFEEDNHNAYRNPFGMSILRSFALNLYQLFFNEHKGEKIIVNGYKKQAKLTMAQLKHYCAEHDELVFDLFEL